MKPSIMQPRFENVDPKTLIGMKERMSIADNRTFQLFSTFMPRRREIQQVSSEDVWDLRVYPDDYFINFSPVREFDKWALVEVDNFDHVPGNMETFTLPGGEYAVFVYQGPSTDPSPFEYIFKEWLPTSNWKLDQRPHFEIMGSRFRPNHPHSEEEIWIPVKGLTIND